MVDHVLTTRAMKSHSASEKEKKTLFYGDVHENVNIVISDAVIVPEGSIKATFYSQHACN